jgi:peptidoglycan/LPS O-acetylase OafA/YrhL
MREARRQESAEVLRGIAAFSVMWFHLINHNPPYLDPDGWLKASGAYGYLGVDVFFVISGFIIPYSLEARGYRIATDGLAFLWRRIARIEPAYLISVALMIMLQVASALTPGSHAEMPAGGLMKALALHLAYLAPWFDVPWLSPVYWTLAIEFQYYALMLFAAPLLLSERRAATWLFLLGTAALPFMFPDQRLVFHYLPIFGLGFIRFLSSRRTLTAAEVGGWAAAFCCLSWFSAGHRETIAAVFAFAILFAPLRRPLPVLSFLGTISYSLYLIHVPIGDRVIHLVMRLGPTLPVQVAAIALGVAASTFAAWCYWRLIERPSAAFSRSIGLKRGSLAQPPPSAVTDSA